MKHILSVLVNNSSGVLSHVSGLFTRRGYNIEALSVGETHEHAKSIITLVVDEDDKMVVQITKQLYKLADVLQISDLTYAESVKREMVLLTLSTSKEKRQEILSLLNAFKGKIVDMNESFLLVQMVGSPRHVQAFLDAFKDYGIVDMARTGTVALPMRMPLDDIN